MLGEILPIILNTNDKIKIGINTDTNNSDITVLKTDIAGWYIPAVTVPPSVVIKVNNIGNTNWIWFDIDVNVVFVAVIKKRLSLKTKTTIKEKQKK